MAILNVDTINDAAGTGAPDFPNGLTSTDTNTSSTVAGTLLKNRWGFKANPSNITTTGQVANLSFSNLTVGKNYRFSWFFDMNALAATANVRAVLEYTDGTDIVRVIQKTPQGGVEQDAVGGTVIFTAAASAIIINVEVIGSGSEITNNSYIMIEELNNYETETTAFD